MIRTGRKRILSLFMVICIMFTLIPMNNIRVLADEAGAIYSGEKNDETKAVSGAAITLTATDDMVIEAAMEAVDGGTVYVDYDADQGAKTSAVQDYVNKLLTEKAIEVTAVVSHNGGDSYKVGFTNGPVSAEKDITMNIVLNYQLWVGGIQVTSENKDNITGSGIKEGTVTYNPVDSTLTLNGATIEGSNSKEGLFGTCKYGIWFWGLNLNLKLIGSNEIIGEGGSDITSYGIYTTHLLTISGSGSLKVDVGVTDSASTCYGIEGTTGIIINGGEINVLAQSDGEATGICGNSVTISGGIVKAEATTFSIYNNIANGIYASNNIDINGGTVIAAGTKMNGFLPAAYGLGGTNVNITGGTVTAKAYGNNGNSYISAINAKLTYSGGSVKACVDSDGGEQDENFDTLNLSAYRYINYEVSSEVEAKKIIESGTYTMDQEDAGTVDGVKEELVRQINSLPVMREIGVAVAEDDINIISFTSAVEGTSANPKGTDGRFTFTVKLSDDTVTSYITGTITATAYSGITDEQTVAVAKDAIKDGKVIVDSGADQAAKTAAVQEYVNGLLTGDAAGVTAVVSHKDGNSYKVKLTKGAANDEKDITINIIEGYKLWVGGEQVTEENKNNIIGDGIDGTVTYDPESKTLTLKDAIITGAKSAVSGSSQYRYNIYSDGMLNINLIGNNKVKGVDGTKFSSYGIKTDNGDLTISGTGVLIVDVGFENSNEYSIGIACNNNNRILIRGGTIKVSVKSDSCAYGINGHNITISGGNVTTDGDGCFAYGIYARSTLTISGGTVTATGTNSIKYGFYSAFGLYGEKVIITGGFVIAKAYGEEKEGSNSIIASNKLIFSNGIVKAGFDPNSEKTELYDYDEKQLSTYRYIYYENYPETVKISEAKNIIESGTYTMTQMIAGTKDSVKEELVRQINELNGMSETGITVTEDIITIGSFTAATAGTSASPIGTKGSFTFTVYLSQGMATVTTESISGTITTKDFIGLTDVQAVKAAEEAVVGGTLIVDDDADQKAKTSAVEKYVKSFLIADTAEVTTTVSHISENTYKVTFSKGEAKAEKEITMNIILGYKLWVGGVQVTEENKDNITDPRINGIVTYDPGTKTLTLNNASITGAKSGEDYYSKHRYNIYSKRILNINLIGSNELTGIGGNAISSYGIYITNGVLTISGTGSLKVDVGVKNSAESSYGIYSYYKNISINGGTINISAKSSGTSGYVAGVQGDNVTISGGNVTANVTGNSFAYGIYGISTITIEGGNVSATAKTSHTYNNAYGLGINKVNITGGTVTAKSLGENEKNMAIGDNFNFSNGTVKASTNPEPQITDLQEYNEGELKTYRYIYYENNPEVAKLNEAKCIIEDGTYTILQNIADTKENLKEGLATLINSLPGMNEAITVTVDNIAIVSFTAAEAGTSANPDGKDESFTFNVILSVYLDTKEVSRTTKSITGIITATAYTGITDAQAVEAAKSAIEGGGYTILQTVANTGESVKEELVRQINGLTGMGETGITVTADNITIDSFTAAEAGTSAKPDGTDGEFAFTVELRKGVETATASNIGIITATAYTGITDAQAVEAAKNAIKDGTVTVDFGAKQEAKTAAVQEYVDDLLTGDAGGVVAVVTHAGGDTYNVELSKGEVVDNITITMTVNERENPDIALVNTAKDLIEKAAYTVAQRVANSENDVKEKLADKINSLSGMGETGITVTADNITIDSFTAAEAGTSANPDGTDGEFAFTVELRKRAETAAASKTGRITATAYTGITDAQAVEAAKSAIKDGTVTVDFGAKQEAMTVAVQEYVDDLLTGDAEGVVAVVTHAGGNTYSVELSKGEVVDNITITMTVNERENPDIALVNTAKELIEKATYTVDQRVANSENDVKAELVKQINSLSGMSDTGIVIKADDIKFDNFTAATAGTSTNPTGTNGSFIFTVTIYKGTTTDTTKSLNGIITATVYTPTPSPNPSPEPTPDPVPSPNPSPEPTPDPAPSPNPSPVPMPAPAPSQTPETTPVPTPAPSPKVSLKITETEIQAEVELTQDVIEHYDGQVALPITSEGILNDLKKEELSTVRVGLNLPEQRDDKDRKEINLILESGMIHGAKENKKDIVIDVKDSDNKVLYSWTFDKKELSNSDRKVKDVNISLKVEKAPVESYFISEQMKDNDTVALVVDFAHEGVLPSQANVRIYVGNMEGITPGTEVYLYHFNEETKKLETIPYGYHATVDKDGYVTITILHCSDYVIFTKEADSYVSLRDQIKVTATKKTLSMTDGKNKGKIEVNLPLTLEWLSSIDEHTSQSAAGGVTVKFTSSNKKTVKVDSKGNITAKAPGEAVIKVTITLYSKKTKKAEIRVKVKP